MSYKKITEIDHTKIEYKKIYQIQPHKDNIVIMHVGNMPSLHNVNIKTVDVNDFICHFVSKIYDEELLMNTPDVLPIIQVLICINENKYNSAHLSYNFHTSDRTTSTKDNINKIIGKYSISLHYNNKKIIIFDDIEFIDYNTMIMDLYDLLLSDSIIAIIKNI